MKSLPIIPVSSLYLPFSRVYAVRSGLQLIAVTSLRDLLSKEEMILRELIRVFPRAERESNFLIVARLFCRF